MSSSSRFNEEKNGALVYEGGFSNDMYCGQGKLYSDGGTQFEETVVQFFDGKWSKCRRSALS